MISVLLVAATIAVNSVSQNPVTRTVTVNYTLSGASGEKAVVTLDTVTTNGAAMAAADLLNVAGDGNRLMATGMHNLLWQPPESAGFGPFGANQVKVTLKAWSVDAPPDYMVIDLEMPERVRYYTCKEAIPGGIEDMRYKTDYLAMRRIPAAGVTWRMGTSKNVRPGNWGTYRNAEQTHYVKLTKDFYLAVYELTKRHFYWMNNLKFDITNYTDPFAPYGGTWDWPMSNVQYCMMRGWFHNSGSAKCQYLAGLADPYRDDTVHKFWPRDGHEIDAANTPGCSGAGCNGTSKRTSVLRYARDRYGIDFDFPTEAEWEFACRAGTEKTLYNNTDLNANDKLDPNLDEIAWYLFNSSNETYQCCVPHPVGLKKPNAYGLYDMLGNVAETCLDIYKDYEKSDVVEADPKGAIPAAGNIRGLLVLMRGGAFHSESTTGPRSGSRIGNPTSGATGCRNQQQTGWGQPKVATGNDAALSKCGDGFRFWAPCKAVK